MNSMTGYAQGRYTFNNFSIYISIKSLNHRFLDIFFKGSGITPGIEKIFKDIMKDRLHRGKVEITFNLFECDPQKWNIQLNEPLLDEILYKFTHFKKKHPDMEISLDSFLKIPMIFHLDYISDNFSQSDQQSINTAIEEVFGRFLDSRRGEGLFINKEILLGLEEIGKWLIVITEQARMVEETLVTRYRERIQVLLGEVPLDERRIVQEAAIAADRSCIAEELSRLGAHTERMAALCEETSEFIGREADFLAQEMLRETHTIASKTSSLDVHRTVLQIRRQIEKIKQQVQNVE